MTIDSARRNLPTSLVSRGVVLTTLLCCIAAFPRPIVAQPNIVVIMVDDLSKDGFDTLVDGGFVPNLEALANAGVRFDNAFVTTPQCAPSRATFLTGKYAHNHGVFSNNSPNPFQPAIAWPGWLPNSGVPGEEDSTIATWLQGAGYHTGYIGKYLNGYGNVAPAGVTPQTYVPAGWSEWNGLVGGSAYRVYDYDINENGTIVHYGESEADYQTDVLSAYALDFVQRAEANADPFFLFVNPLAPHIEVLDIAGIFTGDDPNTGFGATIRPAPRHAKLADGDLGNGELPGLEMKPSFNEADITDKPSCPRPPPPPMISIVADPFCMAENTTISAADIERLENQYKTMLASTLAVDDLLGALVDELETSGEIANTVVVFTSDNGWLYGEHRTLGKDLPYEESIRVPLVVRAPAGLAGAQASQLVLMNDLAPTLAEMAGVNPPEMLDGVSITPILDDTQAGWHRKMFLVEHWFLPSLFRFERPTFFALRRLDTADFIYVATHAEPATLLTSTHHELYDMIGDPFQVGSFTLPATTTELLDNILLFYRACTGLGCRALESN